jgi:hypothetical protein
MVCLGKIFDTGLQLSYIRASRKAGIEHVVVTSCFGPEEAYHFVILHWTSRLSLTIRLRRNLVSLITVSHKFDGCSFKRIRA